jgi:hypothetical protein
VDILLELRRMKGSPAGDRRRMLSGLGRPPGIPPEWVLEWKEDGGYFGRAPDDDGGRAERVERREKKSEERRDELRAAIRKLLGEADGGMTRKELWDGLPEVLRVNEPRFWQVLEEGEEIDWRKEKLPGRGGSYRYGILNG